MPRRPAMALSDGRLFGGERGAYSGYGRGGK